MAGTALGCQDDGQRPQGVNDSAEHHQSRPRMSRTVLRYAEAEVGEPQQKTDMPKSNAHHYKHNTPPYIPTPWLPNAQNPRRYTAGSQHPPNTPSMAAKAPTQPRRPERRYQEGRWVQHAKYALRLPRTRRTPTPSTPHSPNSALWPKYRHQT